MIIMGLRMHKQLIADEKMAKVDELKTADKPHQKCRRIIGKNYNRL
jgi:hypothetical protein